MAQPPIATKAPGEHAAFAIEGEAVVVSARDIHDFCALAKHNNIALLR